jgi:hypothetical protein
VNEEFVQRWTRELGQKHGLLIEFLICVILWETAINCCDTENSDATRPMVSTDPIANRSIPLVV